MGMKPLEANWSWAVEESFLAKVLDLASATVVRVLESTSGSAAVRFVPPEPGCLTIPKFLNVGRKEYS